MLRASEDALEELLGARGLVLAVGGGSLRIDRLNARDQKHDGIRVHADIRQDVESVPASVVLSQLQTRDRFAHDTGQIIESIWSVLKVILGHVRSVVHVKLVRREQSVGLLQASSSCCLCFLTGSTTR